MQNIYRVYSAGLKKRVFTVNMENIDLPSLSQLVPDEMHALKQINIINCNLKQLPKRMEKLTSMFTFDVIYCMKCHSDCINVHRAS